MHTYVAPAAEIVRAMKAIFFTVNVQVVTFLTKAKNTLVRNVNMMTNMTDG